MSFFYYSPSIVGTDLDNYTNGIDGITNATIRDERNVILRTTVHVKEGITKI